MQSWNYIKQWPLQWFSAVGTEDTTGETREDRSETLKDRILYNHEHNEDNGREINIRNVEEIIKKSVEQTVVNKCQE